MANENGTSSIKLPSELVDKIRNHIKKLKVKPSITAVATAAIEDYLKKVKP
jgi:hypothetical protein